MKSFFVLLNDQTDPTPEIDEAHQTHVKALLQSGDMLQSGTFLDYKGNMAIIRAKDKTDALVIALSDPYVREGCKTFKMYEVQLEER